MRHYEAIIIGSGQGGVPLATAFAAKGKSVALIEREFLGGSCVNYGCTPTKTLVHIAKVAQTVRRAGEYGVAGGSPVVDMRKVHSLKRKIVEEFRGSLESSLAKTPHLDAIRGEGSFVDRHVVQVNGERFTAPTIVVNTGTRAAIPPIPGLAETPYLDNRSILELEELPRRLLILGAGYIGLEFGQMYARFGSEVSIFDSGAIFLPKEDRDIADAVGEMLRGEGLTIRSQCTVDGVRAYGAGVEVTVGGHAHRGDALLVAAGRTPNTDSLNLEAAGVATTPHGQIVVDARLRTNVRGIYAIGDVKGGPAFTHISYDDYRILSANLLEGKRRRIEGRLVPYVMFTDPELGRVGLNETQAKAAGIAYDVARLNMNHVARADEMGETRGFIKVLLAKDDQILGASVFGVQGGEIMSMIELAMMGRIPGSRLQSAILAHPTMAELLNNLFAKK